MKIYTRNGDKGKTGLVGAHSISKGDDRVECYGEVDELNSFLGVLISEVESNNELNTQTALLKKIQYGLFDIGANLSSLPAERTKYKVPSVDLSHVKELEDGIDEMEKKLSPLKKFIMPGGHKSSAMAHVCRTVCRRAERRVVLVNEKDTSDPIFLEAIQYLNRLSDYFFILARFINFAHKTSDVTWR
jgi:cob(I)alamin adenosyltransferase